MISDWDDAHKYAPQDIVCSYQPWGTNMEEESKDFVSQVIEESIKVPRTRSL